MTQEYFPKYAFIDSQNLECHFIQNHNKYIGFRGFYNYLTQNRKVQKDKCFVFIKVTTHPNRIKAFKDIGYQVVLCDCKNEKGSFNIDTDLVITSVEEFFEVGERHDLLLVSGDGDFLPLVKFYEDYGYYTEIIGTSRKSTSEGNPFTSRKLTHTVDECGDKIIRKNTTYYDELSDLQPSLLTPTIRF